MTFCSKCGTQNDQDASFCQNCGQQLAQAAAARPAAAAAPAYSSPSAQPLEESLRTYLYIVYGLLVAGWFSVGVLAIVAVVMAYVKRGDAAGTWCESHFNWVISTFWTSLIVTIIGLLLLLVGIGFIILGVGFIWTVYRVIKGIVRLGDRKVAA